MKISGNNTLNIRRSTLLNRYGLHQQALIVKVPAQPILIDQIRIPFSMQL